MIINKFKYVFVFSILGVSLFASKTFAANLSFTADKQSVNIGDTVTVVLTIDSQGTIINAAQGIVHFSEGVVQLVSVDRTGSVFNFWVEDPNISNKVGTMSFTGGTTQGISGSLLNILTMKFKATGAGKTSITFTDGAVTANDGLGTNVLTTINKTDISVSGEVSTPLSAASSTATVVEPAPIIRAPVPTGVLPVKPTIEINAYPDEVQWYNQITNVVVFWNVPKDVIATASSIDKNPNGIPSQLDKQLFDGKDFGTVKEGKWYVHVRFKNNVGLGPVATHKISIDATVPAPFKISETGGNLPSDNPSPTLNFKTADSLSGIDYYSVVIDNQQFIKNIQGTLQLSPQAPGDHTVKVIAFDKAGNTAEDSLNFTILPIESPIIGGVTQPLYSDTNDKLVISGSATPNTIILIAVIKLSDGFVAANGTARVDDKGLYAFSFDNHFDNGTYKIVARAQDDRGALSSPVDFSPIVVKSKPVLIIGSLELSSAGLIIWLLIVLLASFMSGYYFYKLRKEKYERKMIIAKRDLLNVFELLKNNIKILNKENGEGSDILKSRALAELEENTNKLNTYIKKEVEDIRK